MKYLILFILMGCSQYHRGIVIDKAAYDVSVECEINPLYYILPNVSIEQWDSIQVGDTLYINKKTLRLKNNKKHLDL